ncbi:MAG TPA: glycosyltransferase family 2 protein, partial [Smithellaceae bacterium]|nr:glycosyltransferase family 2 protein [Smithellaceae bacterium]
KDDYQRRLIISLDADTLVDDNYLREIQNYFQRKISTAVVAYEHQNPELPAARDAICCYEIFLRYWVMGLRYADSPYAFHSIGSTIVCTADAYLAVRGMNRREAGEDFYFLNKLAKTGQIGYIRSTCVHPSARISGRVPFGTGKAMQRRLEATEDEYRLYDATVFAILKQWLQIMKNAGNRSGEDLMQQAAAIHRGLAEFLKINSFISIWTKICHNARNEKVLAGQFCDWFDGFKTLKLINYLSREYFPPVGIFQAISSLFHKSSIENEFQYRIENTAPEARQRILHYLRTKT